MTGLHLAVQENLPIPFASKSKKVENLDEAVNKIEHIKLELFMDPSNPATKYSRHFMIFKDGGAEDWMKGLIGYREVESLMSIREPADKSKMLRHC
jgi:hypothetical protein